MLQPVSYLLKGRTFYPVNKSPRDFVAYHTRIHPQQSLALTTRNCSMRPSMMSTWTLILWWCWKKIRIYQIFLSYWIGFSKKYGDIMWHASVHTTKETPTVFVMSCVYFNGSVTWTSPISFTHSSWSVRDRMTCGRLYWSSPKFGEILCSLSHVILANKQIVAFYKCLGYGLKCGRLCSAHKTVSRNLIDWLIHWLLDWLINQSIEWLVDWLFQSLIPKIVLQQCLGRTRCPFHISPWVFINQMHGEL